MPSNVIAFNFPTATERAQALFDEAAEVARLVAETTIVDAEEIGLRLYDAAQLPSLSPGVQAIFLRMAEDLKQQMLSARAILERT